MRRSALLTAACQLLLLLLAGGANAAQLRPQRNRRKTIPSDSEYCMTPTSYNESHDTTPLYDSEGQDEEEREDQINGWGEGDELDNHLGVFGKSLAMGESIFHDDCGMGASFEDARPGLFGDLEDVKPLHKDRDSSGSAATAPKRPCFGTNVFASDQNELGTHWNRTPLISAQAGFPELLKRLPGAISAPC